MPAIKTLTALLLAVLVAAAPLHAEETKLRVAYVPSLTWLPVFVAKENGLFAAHGLDVGLTPIQNIALMPPSVGKGFDLAPGTLPDLVKAAASGLDVVAVAGGNLSTPDNPSAALLVRGDGAIATLADLKGKSIAVPSLGGLLHVALQHWLRQNGLGSGDVNAVELSMADMADRLLAERIDAVAVTEPFIATLLAAGAKSLGDPVLSVKNPVLPTIWIAQGGWARTHQDVVARFVAAIAEADAFIAQSPDEARLILRKYAEIPDAVAATLPLLAYRTAVGPDDITVWAATLTELGQLFRPVDASRMLATPR
jgi:NitT/TauT family transport system substrate-binding protein